MFNEYTSIEDLELQTINAGVDSYQAYVLPTGDGSHLAIIKHLSGGWDVLAAWSQAGKPISEMNFVNPHIVSIRNVPQSPIEALRLIQESGHMDVTHLLLEGNVGVSTKGQLIEAESSITKGSFARTSDSLVQLPPIKHVVEGKGVGDFLGEGTFFKIGPHVYGGEVQDIKIVEHKAIQTVEGVRTNSDFLVDDGTGDADIEVTMLFDDTAAIIKNFVPLIALFRISPITTVRNETINGALQDDFTEDNLNGALELVKSKISEVIQEAFQTEKSRQAYESFGEVETNAPFDEDAYDQHHKLDSTSPFFQKFPTFADFDNSVEHELDIDAEVNTNQKDSLLKKAEENIDHKYLNKKRDISPYVTVAFTKILVQTHPQIPEALVVKLYLKRIDTTNYVRDSLRYRTGNNLPTTDPSKAYWLRRGIDLFVEKFLYDSITPYSSSLNAGSVALRFGGDDIMLKMFAKENRLDTLHLNIGSKRLGKSSVITQMGYTVSNKFGFHRLAGNSYPTAQYMGGTSGTASVAISTDDYDKFKQIHSYKNAADFFVRTSDRFDRFNGWSIDALIIKMFNNIERPEEKKRGSKFQPSTFYPESVVTETDPEHPDLKNIFIIFKETNPNFFEDYGFSIKRNGYNLVSFRDFTKEMWDRALLFRSRLVGAPYGFQYHLDGKKELLDKYAYLLIFGEGKKDERLSVFNPDTIAATFLEKRKYRDGLIAIDHELVDIQQELYHFLLNNDKFSGKTRSPEEILEHFPSQVGADLKSLVDAFNNVDIGVYRATSIMNAFFDVSGTSINTRTEFINKLRFPTLNDSFLVDQGRVHIYKFLYEHPEIIPNEEFFERMFAAVVRRKQSKLGERIYDINSLINAYNSISLAIEAKGSELGSPELANALSKSKKDENKVFFDGSNYTSKTVASSAFPDFMYVTYEELFDIDGSLPGNWTQYAPTYQSMGVLNHDPIHFRNDFSAAAVNKAQSQNLLTNTSPISPSVWFWDEPELHELREGLDEQSSDWFNKTKGLRLSLPFDIEGILKEKNSGRFTGKRQNFKGTDPKAKGLATRIEEMIDKTLAKMDGDKVNKAAEDAILFMANEYAQRFDADSAANLNSEQQQSFSEEFRALIDDQYKESLGRNSTLNTDNISVPFLIGTNLHSDIMKWENMTGVFGNTVLRRLISASSAEAVGMEQFIDHTITNPALNMQDSVTISCANEDENRVSLLKATQAITDNGNSMAKAFPVMRLYLIDFVGPRIVVQDNFFSYNAIHSIDITLDKHDAGLAVIRVADPFHVLQGAEFGQEIYESSPPGLTQILPASAADISAGSILNRLKLKQGRSVQIRGGYSSDTDNLDILFTGKISEIQFGDIVTIVAQDWKSELIGRQVNFEIRGESETGVKDLIVNTIRQAAPAGMGEQYSRNEAQKLHELSSSFASANPQIRHATLAGRGTASPFGGAVSSSAGTQGWDPLGFGIFKQLGAGIDLRLKNIWIPDTDRKRWSYFADMADGGWEGRGWIVPLKSAWEVIDEATNYVWGYIAQVIPYDGEATLFFGRPDQMYFYTNGSNQQQRLWNQSRAIGVQETDVRLARILSSFYGTEHYSRPGSIWHTNKDIGFALKLESRVSSIEGFPSRDFLTGHVHWVPGTADGAVVIFSGHRVDGRAGTPFSLYSHSVLNRYYSFGGSQEKTDKRNWYKQFMLSRSFNDNFETIVTTFGSKQTAAIILLREFFGFQYNATVNNADAVLVVQEMLKRDGKDVDFLKKYFSNMAEILSFEDLPERSNFKEYAQVLETAIAELFEGYPPSLQDNPNPYIDGLDSHQMIYSAGTIGSSLLIPAGERAVRRAMAGDRNFQNKRPIHITLNYMSALSALCKYIQIMFQLPKTPTILFANGSAFSEPQGIKIRVKGVPGTEASVVAQSLASFFEGKSIEDLALEARLFFEENIPASELNPDRTTVLGKLGYPEIDFNKDFSDEMISYIALFRSFVYFFSQYLTQVIMGETSQEDIAEDIEFIKGTKIFDYKQALNMKTFRDYHYIRDRVDIIKNEIGATTREMHNAVVIRYAKDVETSNNTFILGLGSRNFSSVEVSGETEWKSWPNPSEWGHVGLQFSPELTLLDKKVAVYTDLNAFRREQCATIATNVLTKTMRPMYRNTICILGRPIKPWDQIQLNDQYTDMKGPIEVERVIHHYNSTDGWITKVVPHAWCEANPGNRYVQAALINNKIDKINNLVDYLQWAIVISTLLVPGGQTGAGVGLAKLGTNTARKFLGTILRGGGPKLNLLSAIPGSTAANAVGTKLVGNVTLKTLQSQLKTLGGSLLKQGPATIRSAAIYGGLGDIAQSGISRFLIRNVGAGDNVLPVTFQPLLLKDMPLTAGLDSETSYYWSMAARLHWGWRDFTEGVETFYQLITTGYSPSKTRAQAVLEQLDVVDHAGKLK